MNCLLGRNAKGLIFTFALLICCGLIATPSFAADVDVYAEGAYTDTNLVLYIYADINAGPILSFGVKVNYPGTLTYDSATKNEAVWFFGDGTTHHPYMNPENDGSGVVIIGGKLDTNAPTAGVTGTRVLLGTVTFTHGGVTDFSGVTLTYGRGDGTGTYKNFVKTDGTVLDGAGVQFLASTIARRGDADADGHITNSDFFEIRTIMQNNIYHVYSDCDGDGFITNSDIFCIRTNM